jgi:hypothetical protein
MALSPESNPFRFWLLAIAAGCIAMLPFHGPLLGADLFLHGDFGDTRLIILTLEHAYQYFFGWIGALWATPWNYHPFELSLAMSEPLTGNLLPYALFRGLGSSLEGAAAGWILTTSVLNYLTAIWLLLALGMRSPAAVVGALLLSFSMIRLNYMNHLQLLPSYPVQLGFLMLLAATRRDRPWPKFFLGAGAGLGLAWEFWASLHIGWFVCFGLMVSIVVMLCLPARRQFVLWFWQNRVTLVGGFMGFGLLLAPLYRKMTEFKLVANAVRDYSDIYQFSLKAISYLIPTDSSLIYRWWFQLVGGNVQFHGEQSSFVGVIALALTLGFAFTSIRYARRLRLSVDRIIPAVAAISFVVVLLICTRDVFAGKPWELLHQVIPGANGIRAMGRVSLLQLTYMTLVVAYILNCLWQAGRWQLAFVLSILIFVENISPVTFLFRVEDHRVRVRALSQQIDDVCAMDAKVFFYQRGREHPDHALDAMWVSMERRLPTANGYSGYVPPLYDLTRGSTPIDVAAWMAANRQSVEPAEICVIPPNQ